MVKINTELFPKVETRLEVRNETDGAATLYLYGPIRQAFWFEDEEDDEIISSRNVKRLLKKVKGKNLYVHINSPGGDVFESIAIGNLLKQHDGQVHIIVDGLAGSGASVVAMAGDKVSMFENSMMMIHKAWTFAIGNADELRKVAADMDKIDQSLIASYKNRFVGSEDELKALIADESWLTAEECLTFGFCDEIVKVETSDQEANKEEPKQASVKEHLFSKYRKKESKHMTIFDYFKGGMANEHGK